MVNLEVVFDQISIFGLHAAHLISSKPIDLDEQIAQRVGDGKLETWFAYEEKELRLHHLWLYWRDVKNGQIVPGLHKSLLEKYANGGLNGK